MIHQDIEAAFAVRSCLFIGQDRCGHWIVKDARNICGGLFADRTAAIRFAMYECQRRPQSVIMLPDELVLDPAFTVPVTAERKGYPAASRRPGRP